MTQEKDREELVELVKTALAGVDRDGRIIRMESFIDKLLRWKRGDKWWCEHMTYGSFHVESGPLWHLVYLPGESPTSAKRWKTCPICQAKRPGE